MQTKNDNLGKARSDSHDDGWRKRPIAAESSVVASATCLEPASNVHACEPGPQVEAAEQALTDIIVSGEKESLSELHDSADNQAQVVCLPFTLNLSMIRQLLVYSLYLI